MLERAKQTENIELLTPFGVERFEPGEAGALGKAILKNTETGEHRELEIEGAFIAIGHKPNSRHRAGPGEDKRGGQRGHRGGLHPHRATGRVRRR